MDRRVKERLIGASILVALAVLVVPELLSGPKPNAPSAPSLPAAAAAPIRNVTVDLATSKAPASSEVEPPPAPTPAPAQSPPASAAPPPPQAAAASGANPPPAPMNKAAAKPQLHVAAARPAAVVSAAQPPTSGGHGSWSVQLGSFASRANADNLVHQIKGKGISAFVLPGGSGSALRYRVRVGPLPDREAAERMAAKLKSLGHAGSLVAPAA